MYLYFLKGARSVFDKFLVSVVVIPVVGILFEFEIEICSANADDVRPLSCESPDVWW